MKILFSLDAGTWHFCKQKNLSHKVGFFLRQNSNEKHTVGQGKFLKETPKLVSQKLECAFALIAIVLIQLYGSFKVSLVIY